MIAKALLSLTAGPNFAALTTLMPDGSPQTQVMWVDADEEHVLINTEVHRRKYKNVEANPIVTVTVWDKENPYRYVEVRGRVVDKVTGPEARAHIDSLAQRYTGKAYDPAAITSERVLLKIAPTRQVTNGF
jgi:PPOX class probable F420-dependent enzyme